ncbi:hypothetical protein BGX34_007014 [Mortierella sp. NVP85]|nr:hypothetical protein BGX34_007014 [Mortierella sp. NVP85]
MKRPHTQEAATTPSHILSTSAINDPLQAVNFDDRDSITPQYGFNKVQGNDNISNSSSNNLRNSHCTNSNSTSGDNSSSEINPEHSEGAGTNPLLDHHPLSSGMTQVLQTVNHPLSHTAHHGHTLIGRDGDNDYHNAGDAVGDSGVDDDGSNVRRVIRSNEGASAGSMTGNNSEHSRRGSKHGPGPTKRAVSNADTSSLFGAGSANSTDSSTFTTEPSRTSPLSSIDSSADTEVLQVTLGRAVQPLDLLSLEGREDDPPIQRRTSIARQHVRARTISTPTPPRSKPLEYLSDMGPLEINHKVDSGVHLGREHEQEEVERVEEEEEPAATLGSSAPMLLDGSTARSSTVDAASIGPASSRLAYTHISESSQSSQSTMGGSSATTRTTDKEVDEDGSVWKHPLLMDLTTEPESLGDDNFQDRGATPPPSYVQGRNAMHRKGYTMSAGLEQGTGDSLQETSADTQPPGPEDARKMHVVKASDDDGDCTNVPHAGKDLAHGRTMTESEGKRVIIHQVSITDTLAGIALYYGIQVSVLKKCNKLWTNDSIHTRKYLYIPFEECTVARQEGVMVDENSQTVILPQKVQYQHGRSRSTWVDAGRSSATFDFAASSNGNNDGQNNLTAIDESTSEATTVASSTLPPLILPAATPGASAATSSSPELLINSPRIVARVDSKSTAAPAVSSPTMTAASVKSDHSLRAAPLSPRRAATIDSISRRAPTSTGSAPFSENLPNTVVVQPSMTHEALAARFKEMDLVTSEQQQRKLLNQELRTNPVHQRHRTTDLRQLANLHQQQQRQLLNSSKASLLSSNPGSRRTSVDFGTSETSAAIGTAGPSGRRASGFDRQFRRESHSTIDEEDQPSDFLAFGNQQHIYEPDNLNSGKNLAGDRSEQRDEAESSVTVLRRQELVTLPAGMLSFFPSPEHSKKLETPESISNLQNRMDSYQSSLSSSSSGSFRGMLQDKKDPNAKKKARASLGEQTFQPPSSTPSATNSSLVGTSPHRHGASESASVTRSAQSKTVRVHQPYYSPQKWSMMGESLVDDILGAVRGPLQIARRVYNNFTTMSFSAAIGSSFGKDNQDHYDPPSVRRRGSTRSRPRVGQRSSDYRQASESVIELDRTEGMGFGLRSPTLEPSATTFADLGSNRYSSITKRVPEELDPEHNQDLNPNSGLSPVSGQGQLSRRKSGSRGSTGHGHFRVSSSGSTHSTRKRSLRSANPVNRAALMALVNEMERDTREKERDFVKEQEKTAQEINGNCDTSSSIINNSSDDANCKGIKPSAASPVVVDILATPL